MGADPTAKHVSPDVLRSFKSAANTRAHGCVGLPPRSPTLPVFEQKIEVPVIAPSWLFDLAEVAIQPRLARKEAELSTLRSQSPRCAE